MVDSIETPSGQRIRTTQDGTMWFNVADLGRQLVNSPSALLEQTRRYYGTALNPETIEQVLRFASFGYMRDLTDLLYESMNFDGHFGTVVNKRHRAVAGARYNVIPAKGEGLDPEFAQMCADTVRQQIAWLPNWRQVLLRLEWGHFHGRAAAEKIWDYDPAARPNSMGYSIKYRIGDICWIHPRRLQFGPMREFRVRDDNFGVGWSGGLHGGVQWASGSFGPGGFQARGLNISELPLKFITFAPQLYNEYAEREGYGPRCLYHSFFKRFGKREQMVLLEVFGKPWRIVFAEDRGGVQKDQIEAGAKQIDGMGANATGFLPPGVKVQTDQPGPGAGAVHRDVISDAHDEVSKIALGETRTTVAKPGALGSDGDQVAADVNGEVKAQDSGNLSDLLTEQLSVDIIVLNFGAENAVYAPRIELYYEQAPDRDKETERGTKLITAGVPLVKTEFYEKIGYSVPGPKDALLVVSPPAALQPGFGARPGGGPAPDPSDPKQLAATSGGIPLSLQRASRVLTLIGQLGEQ